MAHKAIRGEFYGSDYCVADGHTAYGHAPGLKMCRVLLEAGYEANRPLHIYRGDVLALKIKTIGWGAMYTVGEDQHRSPYLRKFKPSPYVKEDPAARAHDVKDALK